MIFPLIFWVVCILGITYSIKNKKFKKILKSREYYFFEGNEQRGPFSGKDQIKSSGIKPDTLVKTEGLNDWKPAKKIAELKFVLSWELRMKTWIRNYGGLIIFFFGGDLLLFSIMSEEDLNHKGEIIMSSLAILVMVLGIVHFIVRRFEKSFKIYGGLTAFLFGGILFMIIIREFYGEGLMIPIMLMVLGVAFFTIGYVEKISKDKKSEPMQPMQPTQLQPSNIEQLEKLYELKQKGIITEEEFNQQKAKLL